MSRVILVSNRLPITAVTEHDRFEVAQSSGGLATGLRGLHERGDTLWLGWPGDVSRWSTRARQRLDRALDASRCVALPLTRGEVAHYYDGFANAVLWPLFHYQLDRIPVHNRDWEAYRHVNERFADLVASNYRDGDTIWVHDYQLMLVPSLVRERLPRAPIGFFLHIPFPATDVFRTLPWRSQILSGILGSDLIGFHTLSYRRHFAASVQRIREVEVVGGERVRVGDRTARLGVFPMGIDVARLSALLDEPAVQDEVAHLRSQAAGVQMLLGVDRLDYTKGTRRRLFAFERLLDRSPALRGRVRLVLVAVPSRGEVASYQAYQRDVNEHIGRINGAYGTLEWVPIHYVHRPLSERQLVALYRAASVMVVTPLRDGMNLVAKEFVACRTDDDGVLVLSEFAGAAAEMGEALLINPYDIDALAAAFERAIAMPPEERHFRMRALRARISAHDVEYWARSFLEELASAVSANVSSEPRAAPQSTVELHRILRQSPRTLLLLDYDGTLVPFASAPELAAPDPELIDLLRSLGTQPGFDVHIVSGRRRETLERWLGELPIGLHAEHGFWSRGRPNGSSAREWKAAREVERPWKAPVRALLERFVRNTPGALVEEKTTSLEWHYRMAEPELAATRTSELRSAIGAFVQGLPLDVIEGEKLIEVRVRGVHKGVVAAALVAQAGPRTSVLAMGDDVTDADLFRALPETAVTIAVGHHRNGARHRLESPTEARAFLATLLRSSGGARPVARSRAASA